MISEDKDIRKIRYALTVFIVGLVLSGLTALPLLTEMEWLAAVLPYVEDPTASVLT